MKRIFLAAAVVAAGGTAQAADLAVKAPAYVKAPVAQVYDWTGFYIGINAGTGLDRSYTGMVLDSGKGRLDGADMRLGGLGATGGAQVGYNWQAGLMPGLGNLVLGAEADIQGSGAGDTSTCAFCTTTATGIGFAQRLDWFGTLRARAGIATGPVLSYLTGGLAYGDVKTTLTPYGGSSISFGGTRTGWVAGSGVEAALGGNWTGKIEYLYLDFGGDGTDLAFLHFPPGTVSTEIREHVFRAGLNYRLGTNGTVMPAPVANWAGLYLGGNFGGATAMNHGSVTNNLTTPATLDEVFNIGPSGYVGGGQIGYNWQSAAWVFGVEADFQGSTQRDDKVCMLLCGNFIGIGAFDQKMQWFGTARARAGYSVGSTLFYVTGGLAYGEISTRFSGQFYGGAFDQTVNDIRTGYAVGGGIEAPFTLFGVFGPHWTAKTEYLFVDLGRISNAVTLTTLSPSPTLTYAARVQEQMLRAGLNYHFNDPVVARY